MSKISTYGRLSAGCFFASFLQTRFPFIPVFIRTSVF